MLVTALTFHDSIAPCFSLAAPLLAAHSARASWSCLSSAKVPLGRRCSWATAGAAGVSRARRGRVEAEGAEPELRASHFATTRGNPLDSGEYLGSCCCL